ncbi:probable ATP-dependent RNA helicase DDX60 isoform X2 [Hyperolius riggenbachi]|uniref:probable ATP-dependent RNA helicase DDX60 isoform X2 n=1 Tax=Hyperolius riggenbachi TaxID=752182 RepID=UPI0035A2780E
MASGGCDPGENIEPLSENETSNNTTAENINTSEPTTEKTVDSETTENIPFSNVILQSTAKQLSMSTYASLLNDYVESEFFAIHGDSLIITCAMNNSLKPGESLHFIYLVEQFLFNFTAKHAKYVVIFFKDFEHLYAQDSLLMCFRTQLMLHLQKNANITVNTFTSFLCEEWKHFLREQAPYFFMVSDEGMNEPQTLYLNMLIQHTLKSKTDVVLTAGQDTDHLRIYGYYVKARGFINRIIEENVPSEKVLEQLVTASQKREEQTLEFLYQHTEENDVKQQVQECVSLLSTCSKEVCDVRAAICVFSCSLALKNHTKKVTSPNQASDKMLTLDEACDLCRMKCLCVALMIVLPLSQRAKLRRIEAEWNREASLFLRLLECCETVALGLLNDHCNETEINWTYVSDISDYFLLKNIAYYMEREHKADLKLEFGKKIDEMYKHLWHCTLKLLPQGENVQSSELRTTEKPFLSPESSINAEEEEILQVGLLPMQSDIIQEYAGDAIKELPMSSSDDPSFSSLMTDKPYDELLHWHSGRPLSDDYDRTKNNDASKDEWALKQYQKLQSFNFRYGQTLGVKISKKIVVQNDEPEEKKNMQKATGRKKQVQIKKKDQIKEENLSRRKVNEEAKEQQQWKILVSSLEKEIRRDFFFGMSKLEKDIKSLQTPLVKYQAWLTALKLCSEIWLEHCKTRSEDQRDVNIAVEVMKVIHSIMFNHKDMLRGEDKLKIANCLRKLGFQNLASSVNGSEVLSTKEENSGYGGSVGSARFQLTHMGPYLLRDERSDPDPRVDHFIPDTWQRELLDVVDNNESAVIVAPTSSGKTYASYYCMEKVLKESNEAVVVYVAPTKALVNQVVATVSSQFNKDLPKGMVVCGVFTRDYRTDALNCQVLVTVPQCLEILLLSPHRQDWVKKIKYLIFDEVHCMGAEIGAEVWEHLLAFIRCPFLALSATISNPEHLTEWLQSIQQYWQENDEREESLKRKLPQKGGRSKPVKAKKRSYRVRLVTHDKRYNDLETYFCSLQDSNIMFEHYHPFAALTVEHMKNYGIPKDLTFSPRESIRLYDSMAKAWPTCANIKGLDPDENIHLKDKVIITKIDAIKYEQALKRELIDWIEKGNCKQVSEVLENLRPFELSDEIKVSEYFPQLVEKLGKINKLPALFFTFHLGSVEGLPVKLFKHLEDKQKKRKTHQDERELQKLQAKADRLGKSLQGNSSDLGSQPLKNSRKLESLVSTKANYESLMQKIEKLNEIPPDCTFADEKAVDKQTLEKMCKRMKYSRYLNLIELSQRGIGYHHGSVDAKGRTFVEMLFRMGYLKVVTATSSLALGINMPCKSVVFMNDSVYLDALHYRQMAGRAGRRGLDLEGNVYFFNIPKPKVKKLMKSNVPELKGQFPLSISLVLRLMLLAVKADDKQDARAKVLSILKHSLMSYKQAHNTQMLKLYCVFSLQFLLTEGYLDQDCNPTAFTGLVTHLHYHEPSNFVFVSFLEKGLFHDLCIPSSTDPRKFPDSVMETLVLVLAHLFGRIHFPPRRFLCEEKFCQSKVLLDNLPDEFAAAVEEYNRKVAAIFGHCILTASKLADMEKEYQLPLTHISFSSEECTDSGLVDHLMPSPEGRSGISPFACLSGNTDHDLMRMTNVNSIMLQSAYIPDKYIPLLHPERTDVCGRKMFLNSYALDFFKHGSLLAIVNDNGFNSGDAYYKLNDFYLSIASISVSMREMCEEENDPVVLAFEQLRSMYSAKLDPV